MKKLIRPLLLLLFVSLAPALRAQVEVYSYAGIGWGEPTSWTQPDYYRTTYEQNTWVVGTEAIFGSRQLAPLVGITLEGSRGKLTIEQYNFDPLCDCDPFYSPSRGESLLPQFGMVYKLRQPDASFNLILVATAVADIHLTEPRLDVLEKRKTAITPRLGAKLTLDFIVVGLDYYADFREDEAYENQYPSRLALTLGGRF